MCRILKPFWRLVNPETSIKEYIKTLDSKTFIQLK
jgi:hypothetical protein